MKLETLYKKNSKGGLQQWTIWTEGATIITEFGQVGGAIQRAEDPIPEGKNLGKKNATTPEQQAESEAVSKWEKQQKKEGYVIDRARAEAGETDQKGEECMTAKSYGVYENDVFVGDDLAKIKFPAAIQPKFDGHRARVRSDVTMWSRGHEPIVVPVPHILKELREKFGSGPAPKLDGELYNHDLHDEFELLSSICRQQKTPHEQHEVMQYHVYDVDEEGLTFMERHEFLQELLKDCTYLRPVETRIVNSHEEVLAAYKEWTALGYEGLMVRNLDSVYEGKRSYGLQKLKGFRDAEYKILGINEGKGKLRGHAATFTCDGGNGETFEVKLKGEQAFLKQCWENHELWKGKEMTVRFQALTKTGVPRIPTGLRIREDI